MIYKRGNCPADVGHVFFIWMQQRAGKHYSDEKFAFTVILCNFVSIMTI